MSVKAILNNNFRIFAAEKFVEGLSETILSTNNLFLWIGKSTPWGTDSNPDQPNDTVQGRILSWADMLAIKKVSPADVSLVIPRNNWTSSTVYSQYTHLGASVSGIFYDLYEPLTNTSPFFVLTDQFNVYKCLSNNSGTASSIKPTGTSTSPITTSDGYIWKYMYTLSDVDQQKFLSTSWMPVHEVVFNDGSNQYAVQQTAINGSIELITIGTAGTGYTTPPTLTVVGDGTGCTATCTVSSGHIATVTITAKGTGYSFATITVSGGGGSGGVLTAIISPPGGHGSDAVSELGGMYVMVNVETEFDESGKISVTNDFRKFGLLLNPLKWQSKQIYTSLIGSMTTNIVLTGVVGSFNDDDAVTGGTSGATGFVNDFGSGILRLTQVKGTFVASELITDNTSGATGGVVSIAHPDVQPNTGLILHTEHQPPITRASDEIENFQIVLPF
jgi:hypothetical protein